jgi:hypothetical protein
VVGAGDTPAGAGSARTIELCREAPFEEDSIGRPVMGARNPRGACPRIRRGRAYGACRASARREEEAMSVHIVDECDWHGQEIGGER